MRTRTTLAAVWLALTWSPGARAASERPGPFYGEVDPSPSFRFGGDLVCVTVRSTEAEVPRGGFALRGADTETLEVAWSTREAKRMRRIHHDAERAVFQSVNEDPGSVDTLSLDKSNGTFARWWSGWTREGKVLGAGGERGRCSAAPAGTEERTSRPPEKMVSSTMKQPVDRDGRGPLHNLLANHPRDRRAAETARLLAEGADPNARDKDGWTPLHFAAQFGAVEFAELLIAGGASVDAQDKHGKTPLGVAVFASRGDGAMIAVLRAHGADPYAKNDYGVSPIALAREIANYDVARFFADLP